MHVFLFDLCTTRREYKQTTNSEYNTIDEREKKATPLYVYT